MSPSRGRWNIPKQACAELCGWSTALISVQAAPKKKFEKGQFERRARMEADRLESLLFQLFEREVQIPLTTTISSLQKPMCSLAASVLCLSTLCLRPFLAGQMMLVTIAAGAVDLAEAGGADRSACCLPEGNTPKDRQAEQVWPACTAVGAAEPIQDPYSSPVGACARELPPLLRTEFWDSHGCLEISCERAFALPAGSHSILIKQSGLQGSRLCPSPPFLHMVSLDLCSIL